MHDKITDIQNAFWKAYKAFRETKDMKQYNTDIGVIVKKYEAIPQMRRFCESLVFAWTPIINGLKEWS